MLQIGKLLILLVQAFCEKEIVIVQNLRNQQLRLHFGFNFQRNQIFTFDDKIFDGFDNIQNGLGLDRIS